MNKPTADLMMGEILSRVRSMVKKELNVVLVVYNPGEVTHTQLFTFDGPRTTPQICREMIANLEHLAKEHEKTEIVVVAPKGNPQN